VDEDAAPLLLYTAFPVSGRIVQVLSHQRWVCNMLHEGAQINYFNDITLTWLFTKRFEINK